MAKKISQLTEITTPSASDVMPIVHSATTNKITLTNLIAFFSTLLGIRATAADTTPKVLDEKFEVTSDDSSVTVVKSIINPGADEKIKYDLHVDASTGGGAGAGGTLGIFGDGSDGDVVISSNTTLTRDMFYNSLVINSGITLRTGGYRIFVKTILTNNGTIENNGQDGAAPGTVLGGDTGSTGGGAHGSAPSSSGGSQNNSLGGNGGDAGVSGNGPGVAVPPITSVGGYKYLLALIQGRTLDGQVIRGGAGGGSAAAGTTSDPNTGGGGGGVVLIIAKTIVNTSGTIESNGGFGGDAGTESPNESGGGGGGGGVVILVYVSLAAGTEQANGGLGGAALGTGSVGLPGDDGTVYKFSLESTESGILAILTAAQDLTAGDLVGASDFVDGKVAIASSPFLTQAFGTSPNSFDIAYISTDKVAIAYIDGSTSDLMVRVGTLNRASMQFTFGTAVTVSTDNPTDFSIIKLDTDKFAVQYNTATAQNVVSIVAATVATNTVTLGTPATLYTSGTNLTEGRGVVSQQMGTDFGITHVYDGTNQHVIAYTFSGTTATIGTAVSTGFDTGGTPYGTYFAKVDTSTFVLVCGGDTQSGTGNSLKAQAGTISGTTITLGTVVAISTYTGSNVRNDGGIAFGTNSFIAGFQNGSNQMIVGTVSGTTITLGSPTVKTTGNLIAISSTTVLNGSRLLTISGTSITSDDLYYAGEYDVFGIQVDNGALVAKWYFDFSGSNIKYLVDGMSQNFIGFVQASTTIGGVAIVLLNGTDDNQSGLNTGNRYDVVNGALVLSTTGIIRALSATKVKIL